jgi:NTE family protein
LVVAVDVTGKPKTISRAHPSNIEIAVGSLLIMFNELAELRRAHSPPHIYISPEINGFGPGDFFKVREVFAASATAKDQLKRELELRVKALT